MAGRVWFGRPRGSEQFHVVRGEGGLILVKPGMEGSELDQIADDRNRNRLDIAVVASLSTHAYWDGQL